MRPSRVRARLLVASGANSHVGAGLPESCNADGLSEGRLNSQARHNLVLTVPARYSRAYGRLFSYVRTDRASRRDLLPLAIFGPSGVDIFFVISGFVMWVTTAGGRATFYSFMIHRITRIVPLYWVITVFISAIAAIAPTSLSSTKFDLAHLAASLLFIPWPNPGYHGYFPVVIPGWTLNYEMMFYVIFAASLFLPRRWSLPAIAAILCGLVLAGLLLAGSERVEDGLAKFYTNPIILQFLAGVVIGAAYTANVPGNLIVAAEMFIGISLIAALSLISHLPGIITLGGPAMLIVCGLVFIERRFRVREIKALHVLGDASYSLYLTHIITLPVVAKLWVAAQFHTGQLEYFFIFPDLNRNLDCGCLRDT